MHERQRERQRERERGRGGGRGPGPGPGRGRGWSGRLRRRPGRPVSGCRSAGFRSAGWIGVLATLIFALLALVSYVETDRVRTGGVVVPGRVLDAGNQRSAVLVAAFSTIDGRSVQADVSGFRGRKPDTGDQIKVRYRPDEPTVATDAGAMPSQTSAWLLGAFAVVFGAVLTPLAFRGRLPCPRLPVASGPEVSASHRFRPFLSPFL